MMSACVQVFGRRDEGLTSRFVAVDMPSLW
jgi:hypothetical protein